jgi:hypothetical protein
MNKLFISLLALLLFFTVLSQSANAAKLCVSGCTCAGNSTPISGTNNPGVSCNATTSQTIDGSNETYVYESLQINPGVTITVSTNASGGAGGTNPTNCGAGSYGPGAADGGSGGNGGGGLYAGGGGTYSGGGGGGGCNLNYGCGGGSYSGGGGGGAYYMGMLYGGAGGAGGGTFKLNATTIKIFGTLKANGNDGVIGSSAAGGGGGGGGHILLNGSSVEINGTLEAKGGNGGSATSYGYGGGGGGGGYVMINYTTRLLLACPIVINVINGSAGGAGGGSGPGYPGLVGKIRVCLNSTCELLDRYTNHYNLTTCNDPTCTSCSVPDQCNINSSATCTYTISGGSSGGEDTIPICNSATCSATCYNRDSNQGNCTSTGTSCQSTPTKWNSTTTPKYESGNPSCCGDDNFEYNVTRVCNSTSGACTSDSTDWGCCAANRTSRCVYNGQCYANGTTADPDSDSLNEQCVNGTWEVSGADTAPPLWQSQGTNDTDNTITQGQAINLTAQGKDETALDWAWLSTNETGQWRNYTYSLYDDFNDGDATGWVENGNWSVVSGEYRLGPTEAFEYWNNNARAGNASWENYTVEANIKFDSTGEPALFFRHQINNYYLAELRWSNELRLERYNGITGTNLNSTTVTAFSTGVWYNVKVIANGNTFRIFLDGVERLQYTDTSTSNLTNGSIGVGSYGGSSRYFYFDNVKVYDVFGFGPSYPIRMQANSNWQWSNFTWQNSSVSNKVIGWKIYYNDTSRNTNGTDISTFTVSGLVSPQWSDNKTYPSSPATYSPSQSYQFNVTWNDDSGISVVLIEHNLTGSATPHNDTVTTYRTISGNQREYYFGVSDLAVGTYVWKEYANDTSNNWNVTNSGNYWIYTVNKATPYTILLINDTSPIERGRKINITAYASNTALETQIFANFTLDAGLQNITAKVTGTNVNITDTTSLNWTTYSQSAVYQISANVTGNANYSDNSTLQTTYITVQDTTKPMILNLNVRNTSDEIITDSITGVAIRITVNATDTMLYYVRGNFTYPNGTNVSQDLLQAGPSSPYTHIWTYTLPQDVPAGLAKINVTAVDTAGNINITNITFTIDETAYLTLYNQPINFTEVIPDQTVNATTNYGWPLTANVGGNVPLNLTQQGQDLTGLTDASKKIVVSNVTWNQTSSGQFVSLSTGWQTVSNNTQPGTNQSIYYKLYTPVVEPQRYGGNLTVRGSKS